MKKLLLVFVMLLGCQRGDVALSDDDERFAALYADFLLVQADYERVIESGGSYVKLDSLQKMFSLHRISSERFNALQTLYKSDPARWLKVQERALAMLNKRRELSANNP